MHGSLKKMLNGLCWDAGYTKAQLLERLHNVTDLWFDSWWWWWQSRLTSDVISFFSISTLSGNTFSHQNFFCANFYTSFKSLPCNLPTPPGLQNYPTYLFTQIDLLVSTSIVNTISLQNKRKGQWRFLYFDATQSFLLKAITRRLVLRLSN